MIHLIIVGTRITLVTPSRPDIGQELIDTKCTVRNHGGHSLGQIEAAHDDRDPRRSRWIVQEIVARKAER